jgi:soluble lytic murein transglycosylase-like protein
MGRSRRRTPGKARASQRGPERWISRLFWLGVAVLCVYFWAPRVVQPIVAQSGYRRVEGHAPLLRDVGREFELDPNLLAGVMMAESSGRVDAVSHAGALGLFQLMPPTARERAQLLGLGAPSRDELLSNAELNARLGGSYLRWLLRRYKGELEPALVAYNAGPGRLDGWIKEHGGYAAWRAKREGASGVLDYAAKVQRYRERFLERGVVTPPFDQPPAPFSTALPNPTNFIGPPSPPLVPDAVPSDPSAPRR